VGPGLTAVLEESRRLGFLGPGPLEDHIAQAARLVRTWGHGAPASFLDLGSGGGVPGLILAEEWADAHAVLLDAQQRRCEFLARSVEELGFSPRVTVRCGRAESLARDSDLRSSFELVAARSFGRPAITAECAVGFLRPHGRVLVSEPPDARSDRWPAEGLAILGLRRTSDDPSTAVLELVDRVDDRWPRRVGIPAKRPLW
jgi:16S rRNA (guanine527-N7)-methyltransferase